MFLRDWLRTTFCRRPASHGSSRCAPSKLAARSIASKKVCCSASSASAACPHRCSATGSRRGASASNTTPRACKSPCRRQRSKAAVCWSMRAFLSRPWRSVTENSKTRKDHGPLAPHPTGSAHGCCPPRSLIAFHHLGQLGRWVLTPAEIRYHPRPHGLCLQHQAHEHVPPHLDGGVQGPRLGRSGRRLRQR